MRDALQQQWAAALRDGPAHVPWDAFAGDRAAVVRAMKIHANTISHARLVALEQAFPRTRIYLGEGDFNRLSRDYLDGGGAVGLRHRNIGDRFAAFLAKQGHDAASCLATFEEIWLAVYDAENATPLTPETLSSFAPELLMQLGIMRHPAAATAAILPGLAAFLDEDVIDTAIFVLITRPEATVLVRSVCSALANLLPGPGCVTEMGALLEQADESGLGVDALMTLITAGALVVTPPIGS